MAPGFLTGALRQVGISGCDLPKFGWRVTPCVDGLIFPWQPQSGISWTITLPIGPVEYECIPNLTWTTPPYTL
jgi:hypothetical protein